jgi:hypothetical protein
MDRVSNILLSIFRETPNHGDWVVACLEGSWQGMLGESMAKACAPVALRGSLLMVEIRDPLWETTLESMKDEMSERFRNATGGVVKKIHLIRRS